MKKLWFKNKRFGWGWTPATWEGWLITLLFLALGVVAGMLFGEDSIAFFVSIFVLVTLLIFICYATGEKPEWRWGNKK